MNTAAGTGIGAVALYQGTLDRLKEQHHPECIFSRTPPIPGLRFTFGNDGALSAEFTCAKTHQGYTDRVHGGLIAAVIDAAMTQCLMGHGITAYTADLSIKYRKPVFIGLPVQLKTEILEKRLLYIVRSTIRQGAAVSVCATGKFYRFETEG